VSNALFPYLICMHTMPVKGFIPASVLWSCGCGNICNKITLDVLTVTLECIIIKLQSKVKVL
jgi:hypothetical protein